MILNREQQAFVYIVIIKLIDTHFKSSFHQSKTIFTILTKPFTEIEMSILKPQIYGNANCVSLKTTNNL